MADKKPMSSDDSVPQADKQASTETAQREGKEGGQAKVINKQESDKRRDK